MKKSLLVADPEIPRTLPLYGSHTSTWHAVQGNKPAIVEIHNAAPHENPNSPSIVLIQGLQLIIRQSTVDDLAHRPRGNSIRYLSRFLSTAVDGNLPVFPSIQAVKRDEPH